MSVSFADTLREILNVIKHKYNLLSDDDQNALKIDIENYINIYPHYGPNALQRRILNPHHIYEDEAPHLFAFIDTYNEPLHWVVVRMLIDYMLEPDSVIKQLNEL